MHIEREWEVMTNNGNEPNLTLSDLYDKDVVYTSRPSYISNPWLKPDEHQSNFLTGRELLITKINYLLLFTKLVRQTIASAISSYW